jgi:hypothetical protein
MTLSVALAVRNVHISSVTNINLFGIKPKASKLIVGTMVMVF